MTFSRAVSTLSVPDLILMRRVQRWTPPRWVRWWMIAATRGGDGWLWGFAGICVLSSNDALRYAAFASTFLAVACGILLFRILKRLVGRRRPCDIEPNCWCELLPPDQLSFPSGHSITAFAVAVSLGMFYPAFFAILLFYAANIAISRVVLGMHFVSDVLAGGALGALLGYCAFTLAN